MNITLILLATVLFIIKSQFNSWATKAYCV